MKRVMIVANLATFPGRIDALELTVKSILPQVDLLNIYLNNYEEIPPFLFSKKINLTLSGEALGDLRDNGKFYFVESVSDESYYLTIDDDIIYPKNYVSNIVAKIKEYNDAVVIGYHGIIFKENFNSFLYSRENFHFRDELKEDLPVSALGTGALGFKKKLLKNLKISNFPETGMADLYFSSFCKEKEIPLICASRDYGWIEGNAEGENKDALWEVAKNNDELQTRLIKANKLWRTTPLRGSFYRKLIKKNHSQIDKNRALVSIIIPTRDDRNIMRTIQSINNQSYKNYEVVIIVDKKQRGAPWARNQGIDRAIGDFLIFLDDDVILKNNCLKEMLIPFKDEKVSFVYSNYRRVGAYCDVLKFEEFNIETLKKYNYITSSSMVRRKDAIRWDEKLVRLQDWDYWLTMAEGGKAGKWIDKILFTAFFESNMISRNYVDEIFAAECVVRAKHNLLADKVLALNELFRLVREKNDHFNRVQKGLELEVEMLKGQIQFLEEENRKMKSSFGWRLLEYLRSIKYPKKFRDMTFHYLVKIIKKITPGFVYRFIRNIYHAYKELLFEINLVKTRKRIHKEESGIVISVAIPIYDRTDELKIAIDSILNQKFQNFELLLITDGSPKETLELVRSYKEHPKVRLFEFPDNSGNSVRGRNKAILEARGKYLAFLDSDDIALPNRLGDTVALFEQENADVVYGGYEFLVDGSREIKDIKNGQVNLPQEFTMDQLKKANYLFNSATAVRTDCVKKAGGLKTNMRYCEDYELWLRMKNMGAKFTPLKKPVIKYRIHSGNLELSFKAGENEWIELALREYKNSPKMPKKVAFVIPTTGIGGGIAVVCEYANRLKKRGYDVTLINDPVYKDDYDLSWFPEQSVPVVPIEKAVSEYDLLIATGWTTAHTLKALNAKRKLYFVQSDERRFTTEKTTISRIERTYKLDYEFLTEAKWIKRWLKDEFAKDAHLVPNAVNEKIFFPSDPLEPKGEKLRVLLEGPIDIGFKGMADAFEVVKDLDCEVWCVSSLGKPKPEWRCDKFFEKIPQDQMKGIYSSCDVILKLSRVEGFFGPPLEMMACGGTAVVGDVTGYDEYIVDGKNALVVKLGDLDAAKKAIQRLIDDRGLLENLKKEGSKTAKAMNWEKSVDLMEKLINESK